MFENLKSKFPEVYDCGLSDMEIQEAITPFSEDDYKNLDIEKFSISREKLIKFVSKQQTLINPGLDKLRYEHLKPLLGSVTSTDEDIIDFGDYLANILFFVARNEVPYDYYMITTYILQSRIDRSW